MIVVAGESLIDLIARQDGALVPALGGGPFNVARALARLEVPCAFLGAMSRDRFGVTLRAALADDGVDARCIVDSERPTMLAVAEVDEGGIARYHFYAAGTAAPALDVDAARAAIATVTPSALHVGALGLALEPLGEAVETLVAEADRDTIVMVDPNWRVGAPADAVAWRARLERVLARADVIKVSTEDLEQLAPRVPRRRAARGLLGGRARCVLVTDGGGAVTVLTPGFEATIVPAEVDVVDTVGAGDAFCAGFLAWCVNAGLTRELLGSIDRMRDAARFATVVANATCARAGADPPHLDELAVPAGMAVA